LGEYCYGKGLPGRNMAGIAERPEEAGSRSPTRYSPIPEYIHAIIGETVSQASYPRTRYPPPPVVDLTSKKERERLGPAAVRTFFNIMTRWNIRDENARMLLGGMSNGPFYEMKKNPDRVLDTDRLTRISYLIGIFKALQRSLFAEVGGQVGPAAKQQSHLRRSDAIGLHGQRRTAGDADGATAA
jgi:hypothetical protein